MDIKHMLWYMLGNRGTCGTLSGNPERKHVAHVSELEKKGKKRVRDSQDSVGGT